jgi:hypothetical protein
MAAESMAAGADRSGAVGPLSDQMRLAIGR